ncbi:unnamed protein product [Pseudo-nitzschia multistriata]|uniref:CCHC-type domain-containing protein n=1 Tax=Pseudo-nitzschia multistriata TaxID=183589 RepID=A0A448YVJ9_9STRA|nr:unnamed protein product [Pseudo-nitzschia multistriata]
MAQLPPLVSYTLPSADASEESEKYKYEGSGQRLVEEQKLGSGTDSSSSGTILTGESNLDEEQYTVAKSSCTENSTVNADSEIITIVKGENNSHNNQIQENHIDNLNSVDAVKIFESGHRHNNNDNNTKKRFLGKCTHCGKKGHEAVQCWEKEENADQRPKNWVSNKEKREVMGVAISAQSATEGRSPISVSGQKRRCPSKTTSIIEGEMSSHDDIVKRKHQDFYSKLYPCIPNTTITNLSYDASIGAVEGAMDSEGSLTSISSGGSWKIASLPRQSLQLRPWESDSKVHTAYHHTKWIIPKWIPNDSGEYLDEDVTSLLFTPPQFSKHVLVRAEDAIKKLDNMHHLWKATLSSNDHTSPQSYVVEATGTAKVLEILRQLIQVFVRLEIERSNLNRLVNDDNSLIVEIPWVIDLQANPSHQTLGARISGVHYANTVGAYIKTVHPDSVLIKALGNDACSRGCALLAVNGKKIAKASQIGKLVTEAKSEISEISKGSPTVTIQLTLCLSKYCDLSAATNLFRMNLRKNDGSPYNKEEHLNFMLQRCIAIEQRQDLNFIQCHDSTTQQKTVDQIQMQEEQDTNCSKSDQKLKLNSSQISKKRASGSSHKTKTKRRKVVGIEDESDRESSSEEESLSLTEDTFVKVKKRAANDGIKKFWHFEEKMRPLISLDFRDTKINSKLITSSMWKKHKELFGEDQVCGENCRCIMLLPDITKNVIQDYIVRQRKKKQVVETEEILTKNTNGLCKYFAPKFVPLLEMEYPNETKSKLLKRLVSMWELHQENRMYGIRCKKNCACEGEWDQLFGKGDREKANAFLKQTRHFQKRNVSQVIKKAKPEGLVIPRKKKTPAPILTHKKHDDSNEVISMMKIGESSLISSMASRNEPYEIAFDSSIALGGYFKTEGNPQRCIIYSKYKDGQMAKHQKLGNGTTVVSVVTGETKNPIHSHNDLKHFYENAQRTRSILCILFVNQSAKSDYAQSESGWDDLGQWISTNYLDDDHGWAGGATVVKTPQVRKVSIASSKPIEAILPGQELFEPNADGKTRQTTVQEWTSIINTTKPGHNERVPPKPLIGKQSTFLPDEPIGSLQKSNQGIGGLLSQGKGRITSRRKRTHSKKVKFSEPKNEEFYFCKNEAANVRRVLSTGKIETNKTSQKLKPQQTLVDALTNGSCKDMLQVLQMQPCEDPNLESLLQKQYSVTGIEMRNHPQRTGHGSKNNDFYAKYRALSIYIHCIHLIERAMCLKKWYALEIELNYIDLVRDNQTQNDVIEGGVSLKSKNGNALTDLGRLPSRQCSQHMSYSDSESPLLFNVHNNKAFSFDQRNLIIALTKRSSEGSEATATNVGCFKLNLDEIEEKCPSDGSHVKHSQLLVRNGTGEISSGFASFTVKKRKADSSYIREKKREVSKKLRQQFAQIERFNQDPKIDPDVHMNGNIFGLDGKSILHAAVNLMDDDDLIRKLLKLGANPRSCDYLSIGSPLSLAQRNYYHSAEKEKSMRCENSADLELHEKRSNQARLIVEMLKNHSTEPNAPVANSSLASGVSKQSSYVLQNRQSNALSSKSDIQSTSTPKQRMSATEYNQLASRTTVSHASSTRETSAMISDSKESISYSQQSNPQPTSAKGGIHLPMLKDPNWFEFPREWTGHYKKCVHGDDCRFFKQRKCRFWHDLRNLLPHGQISPPPVSSLPSLADLPVLSAHQVVYKEVGCWHTAAYADRDSNLIIYVTKILSYSGSVGTDGTCWFRTRADALVGLRFTVYFEMKNEDATRTAPSGHRGRNSDHGDRSSSSHYTNQSKNTSHRKHQHQHQHQHQRQHSGDRSHYYKSYDFRDENRHSRHGNKQNHHNDYYDSRRDSDRAHHGR